MMFGPRAPGPKNSAGSSKYAHALAPPVLSKKGFIDHSGTKEWNNQDYAR